MLGQQKRTVLHLSINLQVANYRLLLMSNDDNQLNQVANHIKEISPQTEIETIDCLKDGCWEADIIFLAVPYEDIKEVVERMKEVATQKIVVCISGNTSDRFPFPMTQQLQQLLPYSKIVTAFKNLNTSEAFIAGNDPEAVETISNILKKAGYQPIMADSLSSIKIL